MVARYERRPVRNDDCTGTKQVHAILWRYIGQAHRKGNLPGRIPLDYEWYMGPGGKSSSPLAASQLITINRRFRASMR
jgi:hypothetical protein